MGPLSHSDILHDISAASEAVVTSQQPLEQRIARLWRDSRTNNNRDSTSPLVVFELLSYEQFMVKTIFFFNHGVLWNAKKKIPKKNIDFMQWTFDVPPLCNFVTTLTCIFSKVMSLWYITLRRCWCCFRFRLSCYFS